MKKITLLLLLAAMSGIVSRAATVPVKGTVTCEKKGVAGVWVTDGVSFAQTDKKGAFVLEADDSRPFIYLTVPAGYEAPAEAGVSRFFTPMEAALSEGCKFVLSKRKVSEYNQALIVVSDPRVSGAAAYARLKAGMEDLAETVTDLGRGMTVHGLCCGNLTAGHPEWVARSLSLMEASGVPFHHVVGSEDLTPGSRSAEAAVAAFTEQLGPSYYSYEVGDVHYIVLNDSFFLGRPGLPVAYVDERQLAWLEKDLEHVEKGSPVLVATHYPVAGPSGDAEDYGYADTGSRMVNASALLQLLRPYPVHFLSGHTRTQFNTRVGRNAAVHGIASLSGCDEDGEICPDGTPRGYAVFQIKGKEVEEYYYKPVGYPSDYQMKIYSGVEAPEYDGYAVANIWNYDDSWNVRFMVDGKPYDDPEQFAGFDVEAADKLASSAGERRFTGDPASDHFFRIPLPAGARTVMVVATDGADNSYTGRVSSAKPKQNYVWIDAEANFERMSSADSINFYVRKCKEAGFQNLVVDVKNVMGEVLYPSDYAPFMGDYKGVTRSPDFDMLGWFIEYGHSVGLRVFASMNIFSGGHNFMNRGIVFGEHPEWQATVYTPLGMKPSGQVKTQVAAMLNPADASVQAYELQLIEELVTRYPALDGILFDRLRFDGITADFSDLSRASYERYAGHRIARFPQDVIEWYKGSDGLYAWRPGKEFQGWVQWRASLVKSFVEQARSRVKALQPQMVVGDYTGGWYPSSYTEGNNWASPNYDPAITFSWAGSGYRYTGFADQLDFFVTGLHFQTITRAEVDAAFASGSSYVEGVRTAEDRRYAEAYWFCVEGAARWAKTITDGACPVIGAVQVSQYEKDLTRLPLAVTAARENTDGLMVMDLSQIARGNLWSQFRKLLK